MRLPIITLLVSFPLLASCDADGTTPTPCESYADACVHPVNRVVVPLLVDQGWPVRVLADKSELCRRLTIDLIGRIPKADELTACRGMSTDRWIDQLMARDEFSWVERRRWSEVFEYGNEFMSWRYIVEIDDWADQLARDELDYDEFIARVAVSPGFNAQHAGPEWPKKLWPILFGRDVRQDEVDAAAALTRPWFYSEYCDGAIWFEFYHGFKTQSNGDEIGSYVEAHHACTNRRLTLHACQCRPSEGELVGRQDGTLGGSNLGCSSDVFGETVDMHVVDACADPETPELPENFISGTTNPVDTSDTCPDGSTRPECADRESFYAAPGEEVSEFEAIPLQPVAQRDDLRGKRYASFRSAFAARGDFWEAAVDRELERYLGWWKSSFIQRDHDIPRVRTLLANELERTKSLRHIQRLILTSMLYTAPFRSPGADAPPWAMGPSKFLGAETWFDSAFVSVGETEGVCDFRFDLDSEYGLGKHMTDWRIVANAASSLSTIDEEQYELRAESLGGCSHDTNRPTSSSVGITSAQRAMAQLLCGEGSNAIPADIGDDSDGTLDRISQHVFRNALSREPSAGEVALARQHMRACLAANGGCDDARAAGRWLCQRVLDSAQFAIY